MSLRRITTEAWIGTALFALLLGGTVGALAELPALGAVGTWFAGLIGVSAVYLGATALLRATWVGYALTRPGAVLMALWEWLPFGHAVELID